MNTSVIHDQLRRIASDISLTESLIGRYGNDQKDLGVAGRPCHRREPRSPQSGSAIANVQRPALRDDMNPVLTKLETAGEAKGLGEADRKAAKEIHESLMGAAHYVPWWVRILSAPCLGPGTMIG